MEELHGFHGKLLHDNYNRVNHLDSYRNADEIPCKLINSESYIPGATLKLKSRKCPHVFDILLS
jgi:hypothetical protein